MRTSGQTGVRVKTARRYVTAFFNLSQKAKALENVAHDMEGLLNLLNNLKSFAQFIENSEMDVPVRENLIKKMFDKKVHTLTLKFLLFLNTKNRLNMLREVCAAFSQRYLEYKEILPIEIHAPYSLSDQQVETICSKLKQRFQKNIQPSVLIDKSVLGGFKVNVKDLVLDYSVQGQLQRLKKNVLKT